MSDPTLKEDFDGERPDSRLRWFCPPAHWTIDRPGSRLTVEPEAKTDFWQRTHYGFQADNGHFLYTELAGDFVLSTRVTLEPAHQYDQAGLMVRISPDCWLKTSVEYESEGPGKLGCVVTNQGYSDWSTQDYPRARNAVALRVRREGSDYLVEADAGEGWSQIRMARLLEDRPGLSVQAGLYACSPIDAGFKAHFETLTVEPGRLG